MEELLDDRCCITCKNAIISETTDEDEEELIFMYCPVLDIPVAEDGICENYKQY